MNKFDMRKAVKTINVNGDTDFSHYDTFSSLQIPGKIRKKIILGEKFDYGEKAKEKKNYVLYVAGQGQEKTEIEEMEQRAGKLKKQEKIVEEKEIIDNYQYHETKDIRKFHKKDSQTRHQRLCSPFEITKLRKYTSYTTEPGEAGYKIIKKTDLVNKSDYSKDNLKYNKYNPLTQNIPNIKDENINPNVYETYKPSTSYNVSTATHTIPTTHKNTAFSSKNSLTNDSKRKEKVNGHKNISHITMNYKKPDEIYSPQQVINYNFQEQTINDHPSFSNVSLESLKIESQSKPEKSPFDGPKYQYKAKNRPKVVKVHRTRSVQRTRHISTSKKGYIPFGGHGTRVGQGPLGGQTSIPIPNSVTNQEETISTQRCEKKTTITNITQTTNTNTSKSNITSLNDIKQRRVYGNNSSSSLSKITKFNNNSKFPGKGTQVGSSSLSEIGLSTDLTGMSSSQYSNYEHTINQTEVNEESHFSREEQKESEKCNEETFCVQGKEEKKEKCNEETFCVQGKEDTKEKCNEETFCVQGKEDTKEKCNEEIFCVQGKEESEEKCNEETFSFKGDEEIKEKCNEETFCFKGKEDIKEKCNEESICYKGEEKINVKCSVEHLCSKDEKKVNERCKKESICICYKGKKVIMEKCNIERLCYRGDQNILYREMFCPVHGWKLVKISN